MLFRNLRQRSFFRRAHRLGERCGSSKPHRKLLVIADCYGRLANRLTVLANVLACAKNLDFVVLDVALFSKLEVKYLEQRFKCGGCLLLNDNDELTSWRARLLIQLLACNRKVIEKLSYLNDHTLVESTPLLRGDGSTRVSLNGLSSCYPHASTIILTGGLLDYLDPDRETVNYIRQILCPEDIGQSCDGAVFDKRSLTQDTAVVGVHVRHGDYRTWCDGRFFHSFEEYLRGMENVQAAIGRKVKFLVVSDEEQDLSVCPSDLDIQRICGSEMQDLQLLSRCDYILATHSSFANWASFAGQVPIIAMRDALGSSPLRMETWKSIAFPRLQADYLIK